MEILDHLTPPFTTESLIESIPMWLEVGSLVLYNEHDSREWGKVGVVIEFYVVDIDSIILGDGFDYHDEIEDLIHYGEWLTCVLLVHGEIIETDIDSIREIK